MEAATDKTLTMPPANGRAQPERARALAEAARAEIEAHPHTVEIDFRGERRKHFVGSVSFEIAGLMGVEIAPLLIAHPMTQFRVWLWLGLLPFEPELPLIQVVSYQEYTTLASVVMPSEWETRLKKAEAPEPKPKRSKSKRSGASPSGS